MIIAPTLTLLALLLIIPYTTEVRESINGGLSYLKVLKPFPTQTGMQPNETALFALTEYFSGLHLRAEFVNKSTPEFIDFHEGSTTFYSFNLSTPVIYSFYSNQIDWFITQLLFILEHDLFFKIFDLTTPGQFLLLVAFDMIQEIKDQRKVELHNPVFKCSTHQKIKLEEEYQFVTKCNILDYLEYGDPEAVSSYSYIIELILPFAHKSYSIKIIPAFVLFFNTESNEEKKLANLLTPRGSYYRHEDLASYFFACSRKSSIKEAIEYFNVSAIYILNPKNSIEGAQMLNVMATLDASFFNATSICIKDIYILGREVYITDSENEMLFVVIYDPVSHEFQLNTKMKLAHGVGRIRMEAQGGTQLLINSARDVFRRTTVYLLSHATPPDKNLIIWQQFGRVYQTPKDGDLQGGDIVLATMNFVIAQMRDSKDESKQKLRIYMKGKNMYVGNVYDICPDPPSSRWLINGEYVLLPNVFIYVASYDYYHDIILIVLTNQILMVQLNLPRIQFETNKLDSSSSKQELDCSFHVVNDIGKYLFQECSLIVFPFPESGGSTPPPLRLAPTLNLNILQGVHNILPFTSLYQGVISHLNIVLRGGNPYIQSHLKQSRGFLYMGRLPYPTNPPLSNPDLQYIDTQLLGDQLTMLFIGNISVIYPICLHLNFGTVTYSLDYCSSSHTLKDNNINNLDIRKLERHFSNSGNGYSSENHRPSSSSPEVRSMFKTPPAPLHLYQRLSFASGDVIGKLVRSLYGEYYLLIISLETGEIIFYFYLAKISVFDNIYSFLASPDSSRALFMGETKLGNGILYFYTYSSSQSHPVFTLKKKLELSFGELPMTAQIDKLDENIIFLTNGHALWFDNYFRLRQKLYLTGEGESPVMVGKGKNNTMLVVMESYILVYLYTPYFPLKLRFKYSIPGGYILASNPGGPRNHLIAYSKKDDLLFCLYQKSLSSSKSVHIYKIRLFYTESGVLIDFVRGEYDFTLRDGEYIINIVYYAHRRLLIYTNEGIIVMICPLSGPHLSFKGSLNPMGSKEYESTYLTITPPGNTSGLTIDLVVSVQESDYEIKSRRNVTEKEGIGVVDHIHVSTNEVASILLDTYIQAYNLTFLLLPAKKQGQNSDSPMDNFGIQYGRLEAKNSTQYKNSLEMTISPSIKQIILYGKYFCLFDAMGMTAYVIHKSSGSLEYRWVNEIEYYTPVTEVIQIIAFEVEHSICICQLGLNEKGTELAYISRLVITPTSIGFEPIQGLQFAVDYRNAGFDVIRSNGSFVLYSLNGLYLQMIVVVYNSLSREFDTYMLGQEELSLSIQQIILVRLSRQFELVYILGKDNLYIVDYKLRVLLDKVNIRTLNYSSYIDIYEPLLYLTPSSINSTHEHILITCKYQTLISFYIRLLFSHSNSNSHPPPSISVHSVVGIPAYGSEEQEIHIIGEDYPTLALALYPSYPSPTPTSRNHTIKLLRLDAPQRSISGGPILHFQIDTLDYIYINSTYFNSSGLLIALGGTKVIMSEIAINPVLQIKNDIAGGFPAVVGIRGSNSEGRADIYIYFSYTIYTTTNLGAVIGVFVFIGVIIILYYILRVFARKRARRKEKKLESSTLTRISSVSGSISQLPLSPKEGGFEDSLIIGVGGERQELLINSGD